MILLTFNIANIEADAKKSHSISFEQRLKITEDNTKAILQTLEIHELKATFFIETPLFQPLKTLIKAISSKGHEVAFFNKNSSAASIDENKKFIEEVLEKQVRGIRQKEPTISLEEIKLLEFNYVSNIDNASILFPFKRLERNTEILEKNGLSIIPESISPYSQLPYNDFTFQIIPQKFYQNMVVETLKNEEFVVIYLNAWQFTDFSKHHFDLPFYRKINSGKSMEDKLTEFLSWINEEEHATSRMKDYLF